MIGLTTTSVILGRSTYYDTADGFLAAMRGGFSDARGQIAKLETFQDYQEEDNSSLQLARDGKWDECFSGIPNFRSIDDSFYEDITKRKIDFVRCRPIVFPMSDYVRWEMEIYKHNSKKGERIFCCNHYTISEAFNECITHDFLIFDSRMAAIHNYNEIGKLMGGWITHEVADINALLAQFAFVKANSQDLSLFANK